MRYWNNSKIIFNKYDIRLFVYEYIKNNKLYNFLFSKNSCRIPTFINMY